MKNFKKNKKFAMFFGYVLGDGWISKTLSSGASGDYDGLLNIREDIVDLFGDDKFSKITQRETSSPKYNIKGTTTELYIKKDIAKILIDHGMPIGKHVEDDFKLPDWITNGSNSIKKAFISGFYAAEGTKLIPDSTKKNFKTLNFSQSKRIELSDSLEYFMVNQIGGILTDLGLKFSVERREIKTCAKNLRIRIDISNSIASTMKCCQLFDMRYCPRKQLLFNAGYRYLKATRIDNKYGSFKLIPTFEEYVKGKKINLDSSFKTPLNNETPKEDNDVPSSLINNE